MNTVTVVLHELIHVQFSDKNDPTKNTTFKKTYIMHQQCISKKKLGLCIYKQEFDWCKCKYLILVFDQAENTLL